ncbi:MAG: PD-(D/E)XK nuclease family protein [Fimbriimonas sp.]
MAGGIRILRAIPGSTSLEPILKDSIRRGEGIVTAFSDSLLVTCREQVPEDVPVDVVPFGKLVRDLLAMCGEPTPFIASSGHAGAAIAQACKALPTDSPFAAAAGFSGTHVALERTLDELRDWGIDAHEMKELADRASPRLASKLTSLAAINTEARALMEVLGRATSDLLLKACLDSVPETDGSIKRILLFAQSDVPPIKLEWLQWAASHGIEVTVVLDRHATGSSLFTGALAASSALGGVVEEHGAGNRLLNNLFSGEKHEGPDIDVRVASAADPLAEAEWAIRGCLAQPEPLKCAIYARDLQSYAPLIEAASKRIRVPVRLHRRAPLLTNSYARLTLAALEFAASKDVRTLRPIANSSYLRLDGEHQALINEGLREAYRMRSLQWDLLNDWALGHAAEFAWLPLLLDWRRKAKAGPYNWREWFSLLGDLVRADERIPWSTSVMDGDMRMSARDTRARNRIEQLLGDYISVQHSLGPTLVTLDEVVAVCRELMKSADVSIPAADYGVFVTNNPDSIGGADTLFVLGMLEGIFPRRRTEDPVLTDGERAEISFLRSGKPRLKDSHDRAQEERDEFYRVCAAAKNQLVFSYPAADDERDNIPAFYLDEVERCVSKDRFSKHEYLRSELAPMAGECQTLADIELRAGFDAPRELPLSVELLTAEAKEALIPEADTRFSPSELRDALQCPFQYVVRHRLKLKPKRHQARWASLQRLPQAARMAGTASAADAERALELALESALDDMVSDLPDWELQLLRSGGKRLIQEWVRREMRSRENWPKDEDSLKTDVFFGSGLNEQMPKKLAKLSGAMPAVSDMQGYRVGHLYVSRAPENRELSDTDKLYYGLHFLSLYEKGTEPALEIETMTGERQMLLLSRKPRPFLPSEQPHIKTVDLATIDDPALWKESFYGSVVKLLEKAVGSIRSGSIEPVRGEHCTWCDYGELCRRSALFAETDSPFGEDEVPDGE